jgi:hypothetical protein
MDRYAQIFGNLLFLIKFVLSCLSRGKFATKRGTFGNEKRGLITLYDIKKGGR